MAKLKEEYIKNVNYAKSKTSGGNDTYTCRMTIPLPVAELLGLMDLESKVKIIPNVDNKSFTVVKEEK